tara:strand:- start:437 stop:634 length:198 start_codon:yes stop_codon:yes gene_type:complete
MYKAVVIILLILILLSTCIGYIPIVKGTAKVIDVIKPEEKKEMTEEEKEQNIIACIKLLPECESE